MQRTQTRIVEPGITTERMRALWESAIDFVTENVGATASLLFAPGTYPLPEPGTFEYKEVPSRIRVSPPGTEIQFFYENGRLRISTHRMTEARRLAS